MKRVPPTKVTFRAAPPAIASDHVNVKASPSSKSSPPPFACIEDMYGAGFHDGEGSGMGGGWVVYQIANRSPGCSITVIPLPHKHNEANIRWCTGRCNTAIFYLNTGDVPIITCYNLSPIVKTIRHRTQKWSSPVSVPAQLLRKSSLSCFRSTTLQVPGSFLVLFRFFFCC